MTTTNTNGRILDERAVSEIEARAAKATPGPWQQGGNYWDHNTITADNGDCFIADCGKQPMSAEFIAHAREDVPALCATVKHLRAQVDKFSTLADERHDLLSAECRAGDELRCERARILQSLERAQRERNRLGNGLANLYHVITGETCDRFVALGMATSAVSSLQSQLEQLRAENERIKNVVIPDSISDLVRRIDAAIRFSVPIQQQTKLRSFINELIFLNGTLRSRLAQVEQERNALRQEVEGLRYQRMFTDSHVGDD